MMTSMKIFDTHTHVFPDKIAEKAVAGLRKQSHDIPAFTNGTYADLSAKAKAVGYSGWMNCPVVTRPGQAVGVNVWASEHNTWPSLSLGGVHPDDTDIIGTLHQICDLGLHGVKFHPEYQAFWLLEERAERIWKACEELALPVLIHAGQDIGFEPPYHSAPADFAELARRHPGLTIVAAHCGGWLLWDDVEKYLAGTSVFIDTSFSKPYMKNPNQFLRLIRNHGTDHVLYGTDSPWQSLEGGLYDVSNCGLTQQEQEDIFWNNARKVWKDVPELLQ